MTHQSTIVVIGNGMVGHRFVERLIEFDTKKQYRVVTYCEESRAAYDRVGLTSFFVHRDAEKLMIARKEWYEANDVELHIGDRATEINRKKRFVISDKGVKTPYDKIVLATGSFPFVPPVPGIKHRGVFVYRTIKDLENIIDYAKKCKRCAVIGGGLLGLEAAKAAYDLGMETHVVEFSPRLMPRQLDDAGSRILVSKLESMGVTVHLNKQSEQVMGESAVAGLKFKDGDEIDVEMIIVSAGIRPRDDLARDCGIEVGERGGVQIDNHLQTSDPDVVAIGEVALHDGMVYGLVAPGWEMAEIAAANFCGEDRTFSGADLSTKLKLMGVDVASFGDYEVSPDQGQPLIYEDPFGGTYKKLIFDKEGKRLLGGVLVGDASDYGTLSVLAKSGDPLPCSPADMVGMGGDASAAMGGVDAMSDDAQVCSCNNVSKGAICQAIADKDLTTLDAVKTCTGAGMGCGGCMPLVTDLFKSEMAKAGVTLNNHLCEHFEYSRAELFGIIKVKGYKTFSELLAGHGAGGDGCEVCKPTVGSILASLWNETIVEPQHQTLQDTNDRFLANIQRGGSYSVVPRVPAGEITPDKLMAIGRIGKKYGLYTKITGGQRIDLLGAEVHQLPEIWEELIDEGFESGHAYGKSVRTVKSCVGSSWCRYGVQDSVGFAIEIENRYRGIRSPHKLKFAVSGCVRECAEAQCKDVGLIATEHGYNLYIAGNGGAKPRHADLFATDLEEATAVKYIDRFLMYYIYTADRLQRTSVWLEALEGGLDHVRDVVIDDKLGLCEELEQRMQHLVDTYQCEWKAVVDDPEKRKKFQQFINTEESEQGIEYVNERGQTRPVDWPRGGLPIVEVTPGELADAESIAESSPEPNWVLAGATSDFPTDGGGTIRYGEVQIAVFHFAERDEWYASQNMCPHMNAFVLSKGIIGTADGEPKVACPLHKKPFSLRTGKCISGEQYAIKTFPVKVEDDQVYLDLPPKEELDGLLSTDLHCLTSPTQPIATSVMSSLPR